MKITIKKPPGGWFKLIDPGNIEHDEKGYIIADELTEGIHDMELGSYILEFRPIKAPKGTILAPFHGHIVSLDGKLVELDISHGPSLDFRLPYGEYK